MDVRYTQKMGKINTNKMTKVTIQNAIRLTISSSSFAFFDLCYSAAPSDFIKTLNSNAQKMRVRKRETTARVDPVPTSKKTNATR